MHTIERRKPRRGEREGNAHDSAGHGPATDLGAVADDRVSLRIPARPSAGTSARTASCTRRRNPAAWFATAAAVLALIGAPADVQAAYRCVSPTGATSFQDTPCPGHHRQDTVTATTPPSELSPAAIARSRRIDAAIVAGKPIVGMNRREVDRALGTTPDRISQGQYEGLQRERLTFERSDRSWVVTLDNGLVTAVETAEPRAARAASAAAEAAAAAAAQQAARGGATRACPSAAEIRDIEMRMNQIANRDKPALQVELARQLREARGCR